jgi:hypothetical protein
MYILSIPSFTWIKAPQSGDIPPARAGHTCNLRDGQIIVFGGYTDPDYPACEPPTSGGIFIFNASSLEWRSQFTALEHPADHQPDNSVLANSFGYTVPDAVAEVIGGDSGGGATATTPAAGPATGGPFATGKPPVFTVTASGGGTATITQWAGPGATGSPSDPQEGGGDRGAIIAAAIVAGLAGAAAAYLGYCAWLYRRQVRAYKRHLAVANRYSYTGGGTVPAATKGGFFGGLFPWGNSKTATLGAGGGAAGAGLEKGRSHESRPRPVSASSAGSFGGAGLAWPPTEPRFLFDEEGRRSGGGGSGGSWSGNVSSHKSSLTPGASAAAGAAGNRPPRRSVSIGGGSTSSTEQLLEGREPNFFSVVMGPRRALRVVNGLEGEGE